MYYLNHRITIYKYLSLDESTDKKIPNDGERIRRLSCFVGARVYRLPLKQEPYNSGTKKPASTPGTRFASDPTSSPILPFDQQPADSPAQALCK